MMINGDDNNNDINVMENSKHVFSLKTSLSCYKKKARKMKLKHQRGGGGGGGE